MSKNPLREFKMKFGATGIGEGNIETWGDKRPTNETIFFREYTPDSERELQELRKDKLRFEWMIGNEGRVLTSPSGYKIQYLLNPYDTLREAIDTAMAEQEKRGNKI